MSRNVIVKYRTIPWAGDWGGGRVGEEKGGKGEKGRIRKRKKVNKKGRGRKRTTKR